ANMSLKLVHQVFPIKDSLNRFSRCKVEIMAGQLSPATQYASAEDTPTKRPMALTAPESVRRFRPHTYCTQCQTKYSLHRIFPADFYCSFNRKCVTTESRCAFRHI